MGRGEKRKFNRSENMEMRIRILGNQADWVKF